MRNKGEGTRDRIYVSRGNVGVSAHNGFGDMVGGEGGEAAGSAHGDILRPG